MLKTTVTQRHNKYSTATISDMWNVSFRVFRDQLSEVLLQLLILCPAYYYTKGEGKYAKVLRPYMPTIQIFLLTISTDSVFGVY